MFRIHSFQCLPDEFIELEDFVDPDGKNLSINEKFAH